MKYYKIQPIDNNQQEYRLKIWNNNMYYVFVIDFDDIGGYKHLLDNLGFEFDEM